MTKVKPKPKTKRLKGKTVLVLRTVCADRTAHSNFKWPAKGYVEAPDWDPKKECGNGLHGCLKGVGNGSLLNWDKTALWQVVEVEEDEVVDLGGKVKFPRGIVLYTGKRDTAIKMLVDKYPGEGVIGASFAVGENGCATAGNYGQATAGNYGQATAGYNGKATAGETGILELSYHDGKRRRIVIGYVGEDGLKPNVTYRLNDKHTFEEVKP